MPVDRLPRIPESGRCMDCNRPSLTAFCDHCAPPMVTRSDDQFQTNFWTGRPAGHRRNGAPIHSTTLNTL